MVAEVTRPTYTVRAERAGRWWGLTVPDVPGVVSQVRNLKQAEEYAREAIAFVADIPEDSFDILIEPDLPKKVLSNVRRVHALQQRAEAAQREAAEASRESVRELVRAGLTGADAARVLGVSAQRVSQLVGTPRRRQG